MVISKKLSLSVTDIEKQESLTSDKLILLDPRTEVSTTERPQANFVELMDWVKYNFAEPFLSHNRDLEKFVHNRIIIDGQFLAFCEENKITVECRYKDSIVSWRSEQGYEKFFAQGVFYIKTGNTEFIHAALFHKGNQNEDEVSFFIVVSLKQYDNYIKLRNQFDDWCKKRDRGNLHIRVLEGDDVPYSKEHSWDDLFLPSTIKKEIRTLVENFLASESFHKQKKIPWKRGFLMHGEPGNGKTSIIRTIMANYDFKPVTIVAEANNEMVREAFSYAESQSPSLLYFEDLDSLLEKGIDIATFLDLLDGVSSKNGLLVVATANNIKKLQSNITNRPSRFDKKFLIPLPNQQMAVDYLKKWFENTVSLPKLNALAKLAVTNRLSYAHLKEIYISSMYEAIAHNRKVPSIKDIDNALKSLLRDKNMLNSGISTDNYLK